MLGRSIEPIALFGMAIITPLVSRVATMVLPRQVITRRVLLAAGGMALSFALLLTCTAQYGIMDIGDPQSSPVVRAVLPWLASLHLNVVFLPGWHFFRPANFGLWHADRPLCPRLFRPGPAGPVPFLSHAGVLHHGHTRHRTGRLHAPDASVLAVDVDQLVPAHRMGPPRPQGRETGDAGVLHHRPGWDGAVRWHPAVRNQH